MTKAGTATTKGTWTLVGKSFFGFVETEVNCTGALLGTVGPGSVDEVTLVEDNHSNKGGNGTKLQCTVGAKNGGCVKGEAATVEPQHMPWLSKLKAGTTLPTDEFTGSKAGEEPGFTVKCNGHTNTCEGKVVSDELKNEAEGVAGSVLKSKSSKCTESGSEAEVSASGETLLNNSKVLSVKN